MHHVVRLHDRRGQHGRGTKVAMPQEQVAEADVLGWMCLYAPFLKYELLKNRLAMCELSSYEMIVDFCNELCLDQELCLNWAINCVDIVTSVQIVSYVGNIEQCLNYEQCWDCGLC